MYDLIIIGSGPAGLSAAIYGMRAGLFLVVIEKNTMSGGQITNTEVVDNYPGLHGIGGFEMGDAFRKHAIAMGATFMRGEVAAVEVEAAGELSACSVQDSKPADKRVILADGQVLHAKSLILATGAEHAGLGIPGEEKLRGAGVSYCATCDGAFFKNMNVAVVGGGDVAVGDAVYLSKLCSKVYLIHRRDSLRASQMLQEQMKNCSNVEILWNTEVSEICGKDYVEKLLLSDGSELSVDGVFIAVGMKPNTKAFCNTVECDSLGYICAGEDCQTSVPGIYAAGDLRTKKVRQVVTAVADGACAVAGVEEYLR